ncbi:hypothetical protein V6Z12_D05G081700 [Gossypium hirsutum]
MIMRPWRWIMIKRDHILFFFVNTRSCFGSKVFSYVESKSWLEVETQRGKPSWQMNAAMLC